MGERVETLNSRELRKHWTCSDFVHHEHRWKWAAWLCGRAQMLSAVTVAQHEAPPDRAFVRGIIKRSDGTDEAFLIVSLPSWGMLYDIRSNRYQWGQRQLVYLGRRGFFIVPRFPCERLHA